MVLRWHSQNYYTLATFATITGESIMETLEQQCDRSCLTENTKAIWYKFKELVDTDVIQIEGVASSDDLEVYLLKLIRGE